MKLSWLRAVSASALASLAATAGAVEITGSGAYSNGQNGIPAAYQPLQTGYASGDGFSGPGTGKAGSAADGGPLGITITWDGSTATSNTGANGGVKDHTGDTAGVVIYDNGAASMDIKFSSPVTIPSLYYSYYSHGATTNDHFVGLLNGTKVADFTQAYPGGSYVWQLVNGYGSTPIDEVKISAEGGTGQYLQLDDITVNAAPEPASLALLGLGALGLLRRRARS